MSPRLARLREQLADQQPTALIVSSRSDVAYLSGFRGSNAALIVSPTAELLVTDFRYRSQAAEQAAGWEYVEMQPGRSLIETIAEQVKRLGLPEVGFQSDVLTHAAWAKLGEELAFDPEHLKPTVGLVTALREVKEPEELAAIRRAAEVADRTVHRAYELAREGVTERALKADLEHFMLDCGAEGPSFDMILAGGPHSALPHAPVTDRPLQAGDLLTIDLGAVVDGYCSDITRTVAIGECDDERRAIYDLVYQAQMAALGAVRAGMSGKDVDEVARAIIRDAGHGDHFGHGLGHGVGLDIHESPRLATTVEKQLVPGNVVTVEPGVYVPGVGGVRIEDLVVVTEDGCERLSAAAKPAEVMILG